MYVTARNSPKLSLILCLTAIGITVLVSLGTGLHAQTKDDQEGFRFRSAVELINITATVTDNNGRFVSGLRQEDFIVYEDDKPQTVTHFSAERVPVSLGIVLDVSGSMAGEKMDSASDALERFLYDLLDPADEIFLYGFNKDPMLLQNWTTDRDRLSRAVRRINPAGGTAMYDAMVEAVPLAESGEHRKKAVLLISDGNDTASRSDIGDVRQVVRETEVLVYAIGIDGQSEPTFTRGGRPPLPIPIPFPIPGRRPMPWPGGRTPGGRGGPTGSIGVSRDSGVNARALREITDDSGGRTELIRTARDLEPATASIADELSKQYYLGYPPAAVKDGRWHSIRLEVKGGNYRVRARRGYIATAS